MNEDLKNEIEAINSIYGDNTLTITSDQNVYVLHLPEQDTSLRLHFPSDYPAAAPAVLGTQSSGEHMRKGEAAHALDHFRDVLRRTYQPGEVCLFDVIEEVNNSRHVVRTSGENDEEDLLPSGLETVVNVSSRVENKLEVNESPPWALSEVVVELKSVFVARCAFVSSTNQAKLYLQYLLDNDKKVRSATHNITAWRIKGDNGVIFQDCDDDGETAAGGRVLHLMQLMDLWNVMVVVTRWYGGHQLGPKRFSIINTVARDAFVKGAFVKEEPPSKKKSKK